MRKSIELSVIVPVVESRYDPVKTLFDIYKGGVLATGLPYEFIYVLDGEYPDIREVLHKLRGDGESVRIIQLARPYGETTAINDGLEHARGDKILLLPAFQQTDAGDFPALISALEDHDFVMARRKPWQGSLLNRVTSQIFNWLLRKLFSLPIHDAGCNVRVFKKDVSDKITLYGEQHRFLPVLANQRGFKVGEIDTTQTTSDANKKTNPLGMYLSRSLELLTVVFLAKFNKRPLRFFGLPGLGIFSVGLITTLYIIAERIFGDIALANRPVLLISSLSMILGIQILAIGLIGEIIIFTHAKDLEEYTIKEIIE